MPRKINTLTGTIQGKKVNIAISTCNDKNYININLANQLLISDANVGERTYIFGNEYEINDLQITVDNYEYIAQFCVVKMYDMEVYIFIGQPWFRELDVFMLNIEKRNLMFFYKGKIITF